MRPEHCGTGRRIEDLPPGDREIVEGYAAWLRGEVAMVAATGEFVPLERAGEPGVIALNPPTGEPISPLQRRQGGQNDG